MNEVNSKYSNEGRIRWYLDGKLLFIWYLCLGIPTLTTQNQLSCEDQKVEDGETDEEKELAEAKGNELLAPRCPMVPVEH